MSWQVIQGDCLEVMRGMAENSVDSIVTDPPYALADKHGERTWQYGEGGKRNLGENRRGFMGMKWDAALPGVEVWLEALRVAKPGCIMLAFGGARTFHRLACAIEDAGWEIRDTVAWVYGQGFPKGHAVDWEMHKRACNICGFMVEYDHDNQQTTRSLQESEHDLRFVRGTYLQTPVYACAKCGQVLQPFLSEQESQSLRAAWAKSETVWPEQPGMEGRGNVEAPEGKLQGCSICQMSHGVLADGAQGWLHHGTSPGNGSIPWQVANADGSRPSYRPQSREQLLRQPLAFPLERKAQAFRGWNVALKPAFEPIIVAQKPLDGTFAQNALKWGVAGINVDGCRIPGCPEVTRFDPSKHNHEGWRFTATGADTDANASPLGRWPANLIHDGSEEVVGMFPITGKSAGGKSGHSGAYSGGYKEEYYGDMKPGFGDTGSAARFFYCAKASRSEREMGLEGMEVVASHSAYGDFAGTPEHATNTNGAARNHHPTVKPLSLMRYLVRLTKTPTGGTVLDPFMGSGTTGMACVLEGRDFVGIELDESYCAIARRRIAAAAAQGVLI